MFTFGTHFRELLKNIQAPEDRLDAAKNLPDPVRDYLKEHEDFVTLYPHSRLVGSYAQHLCVGDVKDVDFLVRVPGNPQANDPEAKHVIQDLKRVLDDLPTMLGYGGWADIDIDVERARRSVHVYFKGHDFHLDVVPCIAPDGFEEVLYVPDRGLNEWIASHPVGYIELLNELDEKHGKKVKDLIRLLKHFRNYQMKTRRPKSYWLGALVVHHVREPGGLDTSLSLAELFRDLLDAIYCQYNHLLDVSDEATPNIKDPMLEHNISWNWGRPHFETFMRRLDEGRKWAKQALEITDDRQAAIGLWQKVFGAEFFPSDITEAARFAASVGWPGTSSVGASGLVTAGKTPAGAHTPTERTTFHGSS